MMTASPPERYAIDLLVVACLASVGYGYGWRFLRLKNLLLGGEWLIIGFSATFVMLDKSGLWPSASVVWHFLDPFSRLLGFPLITSLGLLQVTHGLRPSVRSELLLFAACFAITWAFLNWGPLQPVLPYAYLVTGVGFMLLLAWLTREAFRAGLTAHGWAMLAVIVANLFIALLQDFVRLPTEDSSLLLNQWVLEHIVWSLSFAEMFYVYRALDRRKNGGGADRVGGVGSLAAAAP